MITPTKPKNPSIRVLTMKDTLTRVRKLIDSIHALEAWYDSYAQKELEKKDASK